MLHQLLNNIERYLVADCSLQDLEIWLLSNLQEILDSGDAEAIKIANEVDADLIELGEGLIDEATLRDRLESLIRLRETVQVTFSEIERSADIHTSAATPVEDLRLAHEFA